MDLITGRAPPPHEPIHITPRGLTRSQNPGARIVVPLCTLSRSDVDNDRAPTRWPLCGGHSARPRSVSRAPSWRPRSIWGRTVRDRAGTRTGGRRGTTTAGPPRCASTRGGSSLAGRHVLHCNNTWTRRLWIRIQQKQYRETPSLRHPAHTIGHGFRCMMDGSSLACHGGPARTCTAAIRARGGPERTGSGRLGDDGESHKESARAGRRIAGAIGERLADAALVARERHTVVAGPGTGAVAGEGRVNVPVPVAARGV